MPLPYPPVIKAAVYQSGEPPALAIETSCPQEEQEVCSLDALGIEPTASAPRGVSYDAPHQDLPARAAGRLLLASGVDKGFITWRIANAPRVVAAKLELYYLASGALTSLWTKVIVWDPGACPAIGATPFDGDLGRVDTERATGAKGVTVTYVPSPDFPTSHLNVQQAPYKLEMTLLTVTGAVVKTRRRCVYIDVVVASIALRLGPREWIPALTGPADKGFNRRNQFVWEKLHTQRHGALDRPARILLDGNFFSRESDDMTSHASGDGWAARWRDGPYLPIQADVEVFNRANTPVKAPLALGGARFLWDWHGRPKLDLSNLEKSCADGMARAYDLGHMKNGFEIARAGFNTREEDGGRLGGRAPLFKHADDGHTRYNGGAGAFPFAMEACVSRRAALFSSARLDGRCAGQTGVVFTPSVISDDQFRLCAYFAYGERNAWDQAEPDVEQGGGRHLVPYAVPAAETEWMTVARLVTVARHWLPKATLGEIGFSWPDVVREFDRSGIDFKTVAAEKPTVMPRDVFVRLLTAQINNLPLGTRVYFAPDTEQFTAGYAIKLRTHDELVKAVTTIYQGQLVTQGQHGGQTSLAAFAYSYCELADPEKLPGFAYLPWVKRELVAEALVSAIGGEVVKSAFMVRSDVDAGHRLVELIWPDASKHLARCKSISIDTLRSVCGLLKQQLAPNEPGLHYFQFDYESNLQTYSASGWGFRTPSNFTQCPECDAQLSVQDQQKRTCGTCQSPLHDDGTLMTLVPLSMVRPVGWLDLATNLSGVVALALKPEDPANETLAQQLTLQSMPGARASVLVAHEMGHELFLPHATTGFNRQDINLNAASGVQATLLAQFVETLDKSPALLKKVTESTAPTGANTDLHASDYSACMMGYNFAGLWKMHFCFKCLLRLRGWTRKGIESIR